MAGGKAAKRVVAIAERSNKAMQLRKQGKTYRAISIAVAAEYGITYSESMAHEDVTRELKRIQTELKQSTDEVRTLELERLDNLLSKLNNQINSGDLNAIDRALKISERRCKILGVDAPIEIRIREQVQIQVEANLNLFFKAIYDSTAIADDVKQQLFEIAANLGSESDYVFKSAHPENGLQAVE